MFKRIFKNLFTTITGVIVSTATVATSNDPTSLETLITSIAALLLGFFAKDK